MGHRVLWMKRVTQSIIYTHWKDSATLTRKLVRTKGRTFEQRRRRCTTSLTTPNCWTRSVKSQKLSKLRWAFRHRLHSAATETVAAMATARTEQVRHNLTRINTTKSLTGRCKEQMEMLSNRVRPRLLCQRLLQMTYSSSVMNRTLQLQVRPRMNQRWSSLTMTRMTRSILAPQLHCLHLETRHSTRSIVYSVEGPRVPQLWVRLRRHYRLNLLEHRGRR
mmetsp:Transcript_4994/g.10595  ORF Transcript_4994/g.10595 Transcript_4994/m.10595 type:complete len:220 (+) Transcript_4994:355-1014(+)